MILFGCMVEYHPNSAKDQSRLHQFGKKVLPGVVPGYALHAERIWKGDVLITDIEEVAKSSKTHCKGNYEVDKW